MEDDKNIAIESHPWQPFVPPHTKVLFLGTFPPKPSRWSMDFYYPNRINDFWRVIGIVFFDNPDRFWNAVSGSFRLDDIKNFLTERGIALGDTGARVRRLRDNASDKYLEIVETVNLRALLGMMPECHTIAATGEKAATVLSELVGSVPPPSGASVEAVFENRRLSLWRMPSTSRAYPLAVAKKAEVYAKLFRSIGLVR